jgi:hypothetical protein
MACETPELLQDGRRGGGVAARVRAQQADRVRIAVLTTFGDSDAVSEGT